MKFRKLAEQVKSTAVGSNLIPGGILSMMRRPQFAKSNYLITFKKEKKNKEKSRGVIYFAKAKKPEWIWN